MMLYNTLKERTYLYCLLVVFTNDEYKDKELASTFL